MSAIDMPPDTPAAPPLPRARAGAEPDSARAGGDAALWASAFVLAALVVLQAGRLAGGVAGVPRVAGGAAAERGPAAVPGVIGALFESRALALPARDVVSQVGPYTVLTFDGGNEDILLVLDSRAEDLYSYRVVNQNRLDLLGRESLSEMFASARLAGTAGGRR
jgi:hypothetical protein